MFAGVRRRLVLAYTAVVSATLLLLGPILYLAVTQQMDVAADATLRLAAQRQAALALVQRGVTLGISNRFKATPTLAQHDTVYLLLTPNGQLRANPSHVQQAGLPDTGAARRAARAQAGVFSTLVTHDAGAERLFSVPILRQGRVVAVLQAGQSLAALRAAKDALVTLLLALGAVAVAAAAVGGVVLTRQAMRPINAAFAAQRAFVADASHELRAPVTVVRTNAEVLREAGALTDPADQAMLDDIVAVATRMGRLVGDLLTLTRLDAGTLPLEQAPVALDVVVAAACRQMVRLAARQGVRLVMAHADPVTVRGDAGRLEQVLVILLDNAIAYNRPGGTVEVRVRRDGAQAQLEVRDTGRGIAPGELQHVCARFHRGRAVERMVPGSGLGLTIAQGLVVAHHGQLHVQSAEGHGATVSVLLPLATHAPPPQAVPSSDAS